MFTFQPSEPVKHQIPDLTTINRDLAGLCELDRMTDQKIDRASCRFVAQADSNGTPVLRLELFHPVPSLAGMKVEFELLSGTTLEQAKKLAESVNERTMGVVVSTQPTIQPG